MWNRSHILSLLLIKSGYFLSLVYFENVLFQQYTFKFMIFASLFNHLFAFFLACGAVENLPRVLKQIFFSISAAYVLVVLSGANAVRWNSLAFALFLSSVSFNCLHFGATSVEDILNE